MNKKVLIIAVVVLSVILIAGLALCVTMAASSKDSGQEERAETPAATLQDVNAPEQNDVTADQQEETEEAMGIADQTKPADIEAEAPTVPAVEPMQPPQETEPEKPTEKTEDPTVEPTQPPKETTPDAPTQATEAPTEKEPEDLSDIPLGENELPWD